MYCGYDMFHQHAQSSLREGAAPKGLREPAGN